MHLGPGFEHENPFNGFRQDAMDFFAGREIKWHGPKGRLDASIVSSQVSCVNCMFPFVHASGHLAAWLKTIYPDLAEVLTINARTEPVLKSGNQPFLSFEWIGERRYLKERGGKRGAFQTNADVVCRFRQSDGKIHVVLTEWKYCESDLHPEELRISRNGTNRVRIYEGELGKPGCQVRLGTVPFERLFRLPIYQLMRLQLLASSMEREHEMGADIVSVLHIAPRSNTDLIDPALAAELAPGAQCSVPDVWSRFVVPGRFHHIALEDLVPLPVANAPESEWADYITSRYGGIGTTG